MNIAHQAIKRALLTALYVRDRDPHWDRGQGHYPDQVYERYEDYYRPSKYRRSEHDPAAPRGDRSPRDRSRDRSRERHREDEKKEERNDRQKERYQNDTCHLINLASYLPNLTWQ